MTYIAHQRQSRPVPVGGVVSATTEFFGGKQAHECTDKANAQAQPLIDIRQDLKRNWNPKPAIKSADIRAIVLKLEGLVAETKRQLLASPWRSAANDSEAQMLGQVRDLDRYYIGSSVFWGAGSKAFLAAADQADQQKVAGVEAPDFKKWVLRVFTEANSGMTMVYAFRCMEPGILALARTIAAFFKKVAAFVKAVVGFVVDAVNTAVKVGGMLGTILKVSAFAGVLGGGYYAYLQIQKRKKP